jgi:hypothetical protein
MIQQNNILWNKFNGLSRSALVHFASGYFPLYIVNEYPKSGGTWIGQMLGKALDLPFPRNRLPMLTSCIMHGHYLQSWNMKNVLIVWRDGRDVMVSQYFHSLFYNDKGNALGVERARNNLPFKDYDDIQTNLPKFIEYVFEEKKHPRFSYADFVRHWHGRKNVVYTSYENMRRDTVGELQRIVYELTGTKLSLEKAVEIENEFSFERQSGRKVGEENKKSFMRKGVIGDWRNHFTEEACKVFDQFAGNELIRLGYEKDNSWVQNK